MKSYINCYRKGSSIVHKFIENGERKIETVDYQPIYGYKTKELSEWKDIYNNNLHTIRFPNIKAANDWKKENDGLFEIYGDIQHHLGFIGETYKGDLVVQKQSMNIYAIDIETYGSDGFSNADNPKDFINLITFTNMNTKHNYVFGLKDYKSKSKLVTYQKCESEKDLLEHIIDFFQRMDVDYFTSWYGDGFDIPYICKRILLLFNDKKLKQLSPTGKVDKKHKTVNKKQTEVFEIQGMVSLDYLNLFQKFNNEPQSSYTLNNIASTFLGEEKLSYKEDYDDLNKLYEENYELYVDYNIRDTELILLLDEKFKYIELAINYAYMMKCNIEDIFGTVRPWDGLLYSELINQKILCSPNRIGKREDFVGGYCKDPERGFHKWVSVYDIVSSYPNQIRSFNISPEALVPESYIKQYPELKEIRKEFSSVEDYLNKDISRYTESLKKHNLMFTCNGQFFKKDKKGIITSAVEKMFLKRLDAKKKMKNAKTKEERALFDTLQYTLKIICNSVYGVLGSEFFRYYDVRLSEAVTMQGQLCARGIGKIITDTEGMSWIAGDTDSVMIDYDGILKQRFNDTQVDDKTTIDFILKYQKKVLEPQIHSYFDDLGKKLNSDDITIEMEHECIADKSIFVAKKNYVMRKVYEDENFMTKPKLKIKGLAVVKPAAYPIYTRNAMRKIIELIIDIEDNNQVIKAIENFKKEFYTMSFETIAQPRGVKFSDYTLSSSGLPFHVRASLTYNKALIDLGLDKKYEQIKEGNKIKYCYIKMPNIFNQNIIACPEKMPDEISKHIKIDYNMQFNGAFMKAIDAILESMNWQNKIVAGASFFEEE